MARKKKSENVTSEISEVSKNTESKITKVTLPSGFGYEGEVTISVKHGNRLISKNVYKNTGGPDLFRLFAQAIAGNFKDVNRYVPKYLLLLNNTGTVAEAIQNPFAAVDKASNLLLISDTDVADTTSNANGCVTTLHFTIPKTLITGDVFNQIALFSAQHEKDETIDYTNFSANYLITQTNNPNEWDPIEVKDLTANTTFIVDWALSVKNA